jgi:uncharacterized protein (TIGR03083 family)
VRPLLTSSTAHDGPADVVERFSDTAERFAVDLASTDLRAPVAACPRWTVWDLVLHLGNVHGWAATIVETGRAAPAQEDSPDHQRPRTASSWYAGKAEDLYEVLRHADPAMPCWNFADGDDGPGSTAGFWQRRQLHEVTVHLLDLEAVRGERVELDPDLCVDGVDEVLTVFGRRMHARGFPADLQAPLCLLASDTGDAWTLTPSPGPPGVVTRRHPTADRVTAPADVLYRLLWGRLPDDEQDAFTVSGDEQRVAAWLGSRLVP